MSLITFTNYAPNRYYVWSETTSPLGDIYFSNFSSSFVYEPISDAILTVSTLSTIASFMTTLKKE